MLQELGGYMQRCPKAPQRFGSRVFGREPARHEMVNAFVDERGEFGLRVGVHIVLCSKRQAEAAPHAVANVMKAHGVSRARW
jgi:hypothetical protein